MNASRGVGAARQVYGLPENLQFIEISDDEDEDQEDSEDSDEDDEDVDEEEDEDYEEAEDDVVAVRSQKKTGASPLSRLLTGRQNTPAIGAFISPAPVPGHPNPDWEASPFEVDRWEDFINDDYINEDDLALLAAEDLSRHAQSEFKSLHSPGDPASNPEAVMETKVQCVDQVLTVFPGICRDHVSVLYETISPSSVRLIAHILDKMDQGISYPKSNDSKKILKRKRDADEEDNAALKYGSVDRVIPKTIGGTRPYIRHILSLEFPETPMTFVDATLAQCGYRLFSAYRILEEAERTFDPAHPPYNKIRHQRKTEEVYKDGNLDLLITTISEDPERVEVLRELQAARKERKKADDRRIAERQAELEEEANLLKAQADGTISECGCCFGDFPLNRMVHCDNEEVLHWFCRGCARRTAETEIGNSKYELNCMSMETCKAGFTVDQRSQFLDEKTIIALERNEQEANLRMAGIENLASCPFCPYAAEYPSVEIDREFRCEAPDCEKVSCRLCKLESHIPKSCEEHAKETGLSVRRQIEEAMSAALIRRCNKCGTPFVKEEGCNKMTCTRNGCHNVQCYVCSKSCSYNHFDDQRRGGKAGNCPLFENVEQRHSDEVKKAEQEALNKVREAHPEYTEDDLKVKMSENVVKDDQRRMKSNPIIGPAAMQAAAQADDWLGYFDFQQLNPAHPQFPHGEAPPPYLRQLGEQMNIQPLVDGRLPDVFHEENFFVGLWDNRPDQPPPPMPGHVHAQVLPQRVVPLAGQPAMMRLPFMAHAQFPAPVPPAALPLPVLVQPAGVYPFVENRALQLPDAQNRQEHERRRLLALEEQNLQQLFMLRQQRIVDHAERRIQRQHQMDRLQREQRAEEFAVEQAVNRLRREFPLNRHP